MIATDASPQSSGKRSSSNKVHVEDQSKRVAAEQSFGVFSSWRATRRFDQVLLVDLKRAKGEDLTVSVVLTLVSVARCNSFEVFEHFESRARCKAAQRCQTSLLH
jgi:hypothetical protein